MNPDGELTSEVLSMRADALKQQISDILGLRLHRALSWLRRAEAEQGDPDVRFILLWIAFNAAYAREVDTSSLSELRRLSNFLRSLVKLDTGERIREAVASRFYDGVIELVNNRFVFAPYWDHYNGVEGTENWKSRFSKEKRNFSFDLENGKTTGALFTVFKRLYVLRNQVMHGAATWQGRVNREQVEQGAAVLGWLVPIFLDIMLANPTKGWGEPSYPVVERP